MSFLPDNKSCVGLGLLLLYALRMSGSRQCAGKRLWQRGLRSPNYAAAVDSECSSLQMRSVDPAWQKFKGRVI